MRRRIGNLLLVSCAIGIGPGAAPQSQGTIPPPLTPSKATPSHYAVGLAISEALKPWDEPNAATPESAPGWRAFFDALKGELSSYASAGDDRARLLSLNRLHQMDLALWTVAWPPAVRVRTALEEWLTPRVRVAWAERRLVDYLEAHRADSPGSTEHSRLWEKFVGGDLASALASYEGAKTVQARSAALRRLSGVLAALRRNNQSVRWPYSSELQAAIDGLYNLPNLDISADASLVSPFLASDVVRSGPIYRGGYVSQVTAGPRTGFGLLPSDEGIAFYNSQMSSTYTPITDFQQQLQQDRQGRRISKLYYFQAASFDNPQLTITAIIRPSTGLALSPSFTHSIGAAFDALPIQGKGLARGVLAIIGLNRGKITEKVAEQATPKVAQGVVQGANEEAAERIPGEVALKNEAIRRVLIGNNTASIRNIPAVRDSPTIRDFLLTDLSLRSRPQNVMVSGKLGHVDLPDAIGADLPQPSKLVVPARGISADFHLGSLLSNAAAVLMQTEKAREVENLVIAPKPPDPGGPSEPEYTITKNVDFPTYLKSIEAARATGREDATAIRFKKPNELPEFAADENGNLVILVHDFQLDVPAPPGSEKGSFLQPPTRVYRFIVPTMEFVMSYKVIADGSAPPREVEVHLLNAVFSDKRKVQSIFDDESKPRTMPPGLDTVPLLLFRETLRKKQEEHPIKLPLSQLKLKGFALTELSGLDASGWVRAVLVPNGQPIELGPKPPSNVTLVPGIGSSPATSPSATVNTSNVAR